MAPLAARADPRYGRRVLLLQTLRYRRGATDGVEIDNRKHGRNANPASWVRAPMPEPEPPTTRPQATPSVGCLPVFLVLVVILFAGIVSSYTHGTLTRGVLVTPLLLLFVRLAQRGRVSLARSTLHLALVGIAPPLAVVVAVDLHTPLASSGHFDMHAPYERFPILFLAAFAMFLATVLGLAVIRRLIPYVGVKSASITRALATAATACAFLICAASLARFSRVPANQYVASLPVVASLPALAPKTEPPQEYVSDNVNVLRSKSGYGCRFDIEPRAVHNPVHSHAKHPGERMGMEDGASDFFPCGAVDIHADERHGLWVVVSSNESAAFRMDDPRSAGLLRASDVKDSLRPPDALTAIALLGSIIAAVLLRRADPPPDLPADEELCRDGVILSEHRILIGGETWPAPVDAPPEGSEVIAVLDTPDGPYRDHARPVIVHVVRGTLAERRLAARLSAPAYALAVVVIAATPLATALVFLQ